MNTFYLSVDAVVYFGKYAKSSFFTPYTFTWEFENNVFLPVYDFDAPNHLGWVYKDDVARVLTQIPSEGIKKSTK
jgi:hypothetical protein